VLFRDHLYKVFKLGMPGAIFLLMGLNPIVLKAQSHPLANTLITDCPRSQKQADIWYFERGQSVIKVLASGCD
jgi:hypothetical protein